MLALRMNVLAFLALIPLSSPCRKEFVHPSHPDFAFESTEGRKWVSSTDLPWGGNPLAWPYRTGFIAGRVVVPRRFRPAGVEWKSMGETPCRYEYCRWFAPTVWNVEMEHLYWVNESMINAPSGPLRLIPGTEKPLGEGTAQVAFVAEGIPLLPSGPNLIAIRHDPELRGEPAYDRGGLMVFEVDPGLLVVPVVVHIGVDANGDPILDEATVREWFGEFRPLSYRETWASMPPDEPWHRLYTEYTTSRPSTRTTSVREDGSRFTDYDLARALERVDVVFGQCRVGFVVQVEHHSELPATQYDDFFTAAPRLPNGVVRELAQEDVVNVFVAGTFPNAVGTEYGCSWSSYVGKRFVFTSLHALEIASMMGDSQRILAHEVAHALGIGGHSPDPNSLMHVSGHGPRGGVQLDGTDCEIIRRHAAEVGVPIGEM